MIASEHGSSDCGPQGKLTPVAASFPTEEPGWIRNSCNGTYTMERAGAGSLKLEAKSSACSASDTRLGREQRRSQGACKGRVPIARRSSHADAVFHTAAADDGRRDRFPEL